jgi:hypothetical protein
MLHLPVNVGIHQQARSLQLDCTLAIIGIGQGGHYDDYKPKRDGFDTRKHDQPGKNDSPNKSGDTEGNWE